MSIFPVTLADAYIKASYWLLQTCASIDMVLVPPVSREILTYSLRNNIFLGIDGMRSSNAFNYNS